ncbi:YetF domain-containing protein [Neobacillus drentensis]|uniref:DUF421 domain-containing protein n=1 Tax=Neobacillus drentensis TaxID=220684 RepID=UPI002FFE501E
MQLNWIWNAVLIVLVGTLLLRFAGRNSISQMTVSQLVIMITLGPILSRPIENKGLLTTFGVVFVLIITVYGIQYLKMKFDKIETFFSGKPVFVIENGKINEENMKKMRLTTDDLDIRLRQAGSYAISDLEWATIEVSGKLGYKLKANKQPATREDIQKLIQLVESKYTDSISFHKDVHVVGNNIVTEVASKKDINL